MDKNPDEKSQLLFPVKKYLSQYSYSTKQSLYMAVFYPAARFWAENREFPDTVKKVNPGIVYVSDYIRKVDKNKISGVATIIVTSLVILLLSKVVRL